MFQTVTGAAGDGCGAGAGGECEQGSKGLVRAGGGKEPVVLSASPHGEAGSQHLEQGGWGRGGAGGAKVTGPSEVGMLLVVP